MARLTDGTDVNYVQRLTTTYNDAGWDPQQQEPDNTRADNENAQLRAQDVSLLHAVYLLSPHIHNATNRLWIYINLSMYHRVLDSPRVVWLLHDLDVWWNHHWNSNAITWSEHVRRTLEC